MYLLANQPYKTKKAVREEAGTLLRTLPIGIELTGRNLEFMRDLLDLHPRATEKIGCGIASIKVIINSEWKQRCFDLERVDGSHTDFSYLRCLSGKTPYRDFCEACRFAVAADVLAFKRKAFGNCSTMNCAISGDLVSAHHCHVDHAPPWQFRKIVEAFIADKQLCIEAVALTGDEDGSTRTRFASEDMAHAFRTFHNERAYLRITTPQANLRAAK